MKRTRKIFALLLSICMIVTMLPTVAFAAGTEDLKITSVQVGNDEAESVTVSANGTAGSAEQINLSTTKSIPYSKDPTSVNIKLNFKTNSANGATVVALPKDSAEATDTDFDSETDNGKVSGTVAEKSVTLNGLKLKAAQGSGEETSTDFYVRVKNDEPTSVYYKLTIKMAASNEADLISATIKGEEKTITSAGFDAESAKKADLSSKDNYDEITLSYSKANDDSRLANTFTASTNAQATASIITVENNNSVNLTTAGSGFSGNNRVSSKTEGDTVWIAVEVTAKDGTTKKYYAIKVNVEAQKTGNELLSASVKGVNVVLADAAITDATKADLTNSLYIGKVTLTHAQAADTNIEDFKATVSPNASATAYKNPSALSVATDQDLTAVSSTKIESTDKTDLSTGLTSNPKWIVVKVTSEDNKDQYYVIEVTVEDALKGAELLEANIKGEQVTKLGKPVPSGDADNADLSEASGYVSSVVTLTYEQASGDALSTFTGSEGATVTAKVLTAELAEESSGQDLTGAGTDITTGQEPISSVTTAATKWISVKVESEDKGLTQYYVIKVEVEGQYIIPKANDPIVNTDVVTDRTDKGLVDTSIKTVKLVDEDGTNPVLGDIVTDVALAGITDDDITEAKAQLAEELDEEITDVYFHAVAYLDIDVVDYPTTHDVYKLNISPKYYILASKESTFGNVHVKGDPGVRDEEATAIKWGPAEQDLVVPSGTKVAITLPSNFTVQTVGAETPVYVVHEGTVQKITTNVPQQAGNIAFDSDGFSVYEIYANNPAEAEYDGKQYTTLEAAVQAAIADKENNEGNATIRLLKQPAEAVEVTDEITITLEQGDPFTGEYKPDDALMAGEGYVETKDEETGAYVFAKPNDDDGSGEGGTNSNHKVTVAEGITNGTVTVEPKDEVKKDTVVTVTVTPAEGYELDVLTINMDSGAVPRDKVNDTTYTFKMPAADVTVSATFKVIGTETDDTICKSYTDVNKDEWYHKYVHYMIENGLMTGTAENTFAPYTNLNRAMVAQILYAKENKPDVKTEKSFPDVEAGQWYTNAVLWAAENGAVTGYEDGTFKPLQDVTRQELAVMLYGIEKQPAVTDNDELKAFTDAASVADWAQNGMLWAVQSDIMDGDNNNALKPLATATRAEAATMLYQYFN